MGRWGQCQQAAQLFVVNSHFLQAFKCLSGVIQGGAETAVRLRKNLPVGGHFELAGEVRAFAGEREGQCFDGAACGDHGEDVFGVGNHDIEYVGGFGGEEALEGGADFFRFGDALRGDAEALADGEVIGKDSFWGVGIAEESVASVTGEKAVFPLYDHSEVLVIDDDGLGGDVFGLEHREGHH